MKLTHDTPFLDETAPYKFSAFASDLQMRGFPGQIETDLGNGLQLLRKSINRDADGDLLSATYHQVAGCVSVVIFND